MSETKKRKPAKGNRAAQKYAKKLKAADNGNEWVKKAPQRDAEFEFDSDPINESPTPEGSGDDDGVSWPSEDETNADGGALLPQRPQETHNRPAPANKKSLSVGAESKPASKRNEELPLTSRAKQKVVMQERKAGKANADLVARAKKIWERLRLGALASTERKQLVEELIGILTGRVKDFVLKHDAGRVVQTAIKYGNTAQRRMIAEELKGEYRQLAASKYAKFTIGKLLSNGDDKIRDTIVPEFYGHVRGLIKHPEGGWILDDIYRGAATKSQKASLLREWYGAEFSVPGIRHNTADTADLKDLLQKHPEKRGPLLNYLFEMINLLVQKRTTGFTMLHDAMLQYYHNTETGSDQAKNFVDMVLGDDEGDLLKNMAFTASGARTVSLMIAHGSAKDRKLLLRVYKGHVESLAFDRNGHQILLAALESIDDTVLTSKTIYGELLPTDDGKADDQFLEKINHLTARIPILLPFVHKVATILTPGDKELLAEIHSIRKTSSKKDPTVRSKELLQSAAPKLLSFIARQPNKLLETAFGCVLVQEVLLSSPAELLERDRARDSIIALLSREKSQDRVNGQSETLDGILDGPAATRLLKTLVYSGHFNAKTGKVELCDAPLGFAGTLSQSIFPQKKDGEKTLLAWATGVRAFVVEAMLCSEDMPSSEKQRTRSILQKYVTELEALAKSAEEPPREKKSTQTKPNKQAQRPDKFNPGTPETGDGNASVRIGAKGAMALLALLE